MKVALACVGGLLLIVLLAWFFTMNDVALHAWTAPKVAQIDHDVYVQTDANRRGMAAQIEKEQIEYNHDNATDKQALGALIVSQYAGYDISLLPESDQAFLQKLREQQ
jgi:hypothetical protein